MIEAIGAVLVVLTTLIVGAYTVALIDGITGDIVAGRPGRVAFLAPLGRAALIWLQRVNATERPDAPASRLAPALYFALAAMGLSVVPWSASFVPVDLPTGIVLWGAVEALATVVIFLNGWSANALFPLLGAYRYVALGLSYILISMFVLIGVALPAESLQVSSVVESQRELWNVIRQPLGLPLFLLVGLGITFWGPLNFADSDDLAGGTASEVSGAPRLVWAVARSGMLVAFSALGASVFLGGWLGPGLPGPVWLLLKTVLLVVLLLVIGRTVARVPPERFVTLAWVVLLPLSFLDLAWAGLEAL